MNYKDFIATTISSILILTSCSEKVIKFEKEHLELLNNVKISIDENSENTLKLDAKPEGGIAVLKNIDFDSGTIDLELKGENNPGRSFVGFAFNVQNDSTYEAIYFRPFNFQSEEQIK